MWKLWYMLYTRFELSSKQMEHMELHQLGIYLQGHWFNSLRAAATTLRSPSPRPEALAASPGRVLTSADISGPAGRVTATPLSTGKWSELHGQQAARHASDRGERKQNAREVGWNQTGRKHDDKYVIAWKDGKLKWYFINGVACSYR